MAPVLVCPAASTSFDFPHGPPQTRRFPRHPPRKRNRIEDRRATVITPLMPTYNRADLAFAICHLIGVRPQAAAAA